MPSSDAPSSPRNRRTTPDDLPPAADTGQLEPPEGGGMPPEPEEPEGGLAALAHPDTLDSAELAQRRRTVASSGTSQVGSRQTSGINGHRGPSIRSPFFAVTVLLAVVSWFIALISQAIVTARIGNFPIGTLWFALILQNILIGLILKSLTSLSPSRALHAHSNTIAHLASMTTVLASIGINNNVFSSFPAQQATAAGWLIAAIVDIVWVFYFSAEEGSTIRVTVDNFSPGIRGEANRGSNPPPVGPEMNPEGDEEEAIPKPKPRLGFSLSRKLPPLTPPAFRLKSARLRKSRPEESGTTKNETGGETEPENGGAPTTDAGSDGVGDLYNRRSAARSTSVNPGDSLIPLDSRPVSSAPSGAGGGAPSTSASAGSRVKAQALYSYKGNDADPHELTFAKGEMFEVIDRSKKWWEAINKDGKIGIVPSNYLQVLKE